MITRHPTQHIWTFGYNTHGLPYRQCVNCKLLDEAQHELAQRFLTCEEYILSEVHDS